MKIKVFYPDPDGSIRFSKQELQALLDEVYKEGYNDARPYYWNSPSWTWTNSPNITTTPYVTYTTVSSSNATTASNSCTTYNPDTPHTNTLNAAGQVLTMASSEEAPEPKTYQIEFKNDQKLKVS